MAAPRDPLNPQDGNGKLFGRTGAVSRRTFLGGTATGAAALAATRFETLAAGGGAARAARALAQDVKAGGTLNYGLGFDVDETLDPQVTNFDSTIRVTLNICEPLVWMPNATDIVPGLAESWEVSPDGLEYTFKLKQGVKFHDGTPFNAEAVQFTFDRVNAAAKKTASGGTPDPENDITSGQSHDQIGTYDHSEIIDDYTIKMVLSAPFSPFLTGLNGYLGIVSPTAVKTMGLAAFAQAPVGTGPFKFKEWVVADHITVEKNPDYNWGSSSFPNPGAAYLDEIVFKIIPDAAIRTGTLISGETDYIDTVDPLQLEDLRSNEDIEVIEQGQPGSGYILLFNLARDSGISDVKVRQALHYALDKDALNQAVWGGIFSPASSPLMKPTFAYEPKTETMFQYDVEKAKSLLDEAGWTLNGDVREKDGKKLELYWPFIDRPQDNAEATFVQGAWKEIGVDLKVDPMERALASQTIREEGNYDIASLWFSYADPDVLRSIFYSKNFDTFNRAKYSNPDVDKMLEDAAASSDPEERTTLYSQIQIKVLEDGVTAPMADSITFNAKRKNVQGEILDFLASYVWQNSTHLT